MGDMIGWGAYDGCCWYIAAFSGSCGGMPYCWGGPGGGWWYEDMCIGPMGIPGMLGAAEGGGGPRPASRSST